MHEILHKIFAGLDRAHGEFKIQYKQGAKAKGEASTVPTGATPELWEKHLNGEVGLGIIPIQADNTCNWGALDIDKYDGLDLETFSQKLPPQLVLCRSKSGGAHIYIFCKPAAPAALIRKKLAIVARAVGHPAAEIFPKQEKLDKGATGNWINMPYFNAQSTTRYGIRGGLQLSLEEFINVVQENTLSLQQLSSFDMESIIEFGDDPEFEDAPPCIKHLVGIGFPSGSRNHGLFSMGVFARKKFPTGWEDKVFEYNNRFMGPGSYSEVAAIIRSLSKKTYIYKCREAPLNTCCNKEVCAKATYGIQPSNDDEKARRPCILDEVELPVICYAPTSGSKNEPYWVFKLRGRSIDVSVDMVRSQAIFAREYLRNYHQVVMPVKEPRWVAKMNELLEDATVKELAPDAGPEGQFWILLENFCSDKARAKVKDELILGKPWHEDGRIYFRSNDLMRYLDQQRFRAFKENDIWIILKRGGAKHHDFTLKGKHISCWSVEAFTEQHEDFEDTPMPQAEKF